MSKNQYELILNNQKNFFNSGATKSIKFRIEQLKALKEMLIEYKSKIEAALYADLKKSAFEAHVTETGIMIAEIDHNLKNIKSWSKDTPVDTPLFLFPGSSKIKNEPYGNTLIISPWNYPIKNLFGPALGAITAGNTLILKPSEISENTTKITEVMIAKYFSPEYITTVTGGPEETSKLLKLKFNYIFFTGSPSIGKIIYKAAAEHLTPCTLELGGKSPSIVHKSANLEITAKRLVWGKFLNAGQTCVAPDYTFVDESIKSEFIKLLKKEIDNFYTKNPEQSDSFGRIISKKHFERVKKLISGDVVHGGNTNEIEKFIEPTIIDNVTPNHPVMQEEIFGPILPILSFKEVDEVISFVNDNEKPLALYIFSKNNTFTNKIINNTSSGGVCVNETIMHMATPNLPFGGVGNSGFGSYNGWYGYDTFSHKKPVMKRSFWFDVPQKYPPYNKGKFAFIKFAIKKLL